MMKADFYTYAYLRVDGTPYYIGKGNGVRAYKKDKGEIRPPKDKTRIIFLKQNLTEEKSFKHEIYMISVFGRKDLGTGILHNRTDGGEGPSGAVRSEECKQKLREANIGKKHTEESKQKMSKAQKGRKHTEQTIQKMREVKKGKKRTEDTKQKISQSRMGKYCGVNNPMYGKKRGGATHPKAKTYILTNPQGVEYTVIGRLKVFCEENNISYSCLHSAAYRNTRPSNGWSIREQTTF